MTSNTSETFPAFAYAWKERRQLGWNTPEDYMSYVHPHWRSFDAINPMLHHILAVIYILVMFTGLIGNGIVIWIFSSTKRLRTPSNILVVNLALLDFIMMSTMPVFVINSLNEGPIWGKLGCDVYAVLGSYSGIGGAMSNAAIAYDRHRTIARPFDGKLNRKQAWLIVLAIWLWATPFSLMPWFGTWGRFVPEGYLTTCSFDYLTEDLSTKVFVGTIFVYSYVIPISSVVYHYAKIVGLVSQHEKTLRQQALKMNVQTLRTNRDQNETSVEIRIAKVAIGLSLLFVLSWTPYGIVALIGAFGNRNILTPFSSMVPAICCKLVACLDPLVYAINHPRYRLELQKRMPWLCVHEPVPEDSQSMQSADTTTTSN